MKVDALRDKIDPCLGWTTPTGCSSIWRCGWLIIMAPLIVLVLAAALLSIEIPIVVAFALLLTATRFTGVIPWTVVIVNEVHRRGATRDLPHSPGSYGPRSCTQH